MDMQERTSLVRNRVVLHFKTLAMQVHLPRRLVDQSRIEIEVDHLGYSKDAAEVLVARLRTHVLSQHLYQGSHEVVFNHTFDYQVWASPWDHFKANQVDATSPLWRWVARRWPARQVVRHTTPRLFRATLDTRREVLFPHSTLSVPDSRLGLPVVVETVQQGSIVASAP